jgi:homocysteine S-methyltransferase
VGNGSFNANAATQWAAAGANIIGGCCRVSPADIAEIKRSGPRASGTPARCR